MERNSELDQFDRIPDSLVVDIFNKLADVRSLGRCSAVSKRFNALVPLVQDIYVKIDRAASEAADDPLNLSSTHKARKLFSHFLKLFIFMLLKHFIYRNSSAAAAAAAANKPLLPQVSCHSPAQMLKNFSQIRNLRVELPVGDVGTDDGVLLKWRAEFGSTLQSCVVLGGTKVDQKQKSPQVVEDNSSMPDSFYTNGGLKLRVVWTISSLIAASTRHYLLRPIIEEHPTIRSLVLTDADGQGTLSMGEQQLREFRENPVVSMTAASNRTQVPASNMRLRYAPFLELPEVLRMQGATLVTFRPSEENSDGGGGNYASGPSCNKKKVEKSVSWAFDDGPLNAAVKALMKRRTYLLKMNGF